MKAAIIGATGYGGAELIRLLHNHPEVELSSVHSSSQQGEYIHETYPHMQSLVELELEEIAPEVIAKKADVVFLSTPAGVAKEVVASLLEQGLKVIDLSGDLRLKDRNEYETWYGLQAAEQKIIDEAVYGLSEWAREKVEKARLVSNPGCYPTATLLGLIPLVRENIIDPSSIIIDAKSGVSGAGRSLSRTVHFSEANDNFRIYNVNKHKHIPEIEQGLRQFNGSVPAITFSTHLVPMTKGIMATIYCKATEAITEQALRDLFKETYANSPFIRIRKEGEYPATKEVSGTNFCDIGVTYDERTGRVTVVSVIDNIVKGAAGQAIQNLNIMLGIDERTGLNYIPTYL